MRNRFIRGLCALGLLLGAGHSTGWALSMPAAGLKVWLKADAAGEVSDTDPVGVWPDSSGNGNNATNYGAARPTWRANVLNGKPVVRFDGIDDYLACTAYAHGGSDMTLFVVARTNGANSGGYQNVFIGLPTSYTVAGSGLFQIYADTAGVLQGNFNTVTLKINTGAKLSPSAFQILGLTKANSAPGSSEIFTDGTSRGTGTGTLTLASSRFYLGSWNSNDMNGDVAEVVLYNTPLSAADRQLVEGLLAWKYGLQGSLPSGHAWKDVDPAALPVIANTAPSFISTNRATLNGYLSSTGHSPVTVSVFWGAADGGAPTSGLWACTNTFAPGAWTEGSFPATNVTLPVPGEACYYRYYATNEAGAGYAPESARFFAVSEITWTQTVAGTHAWTNEANWSPQIVPNFAGMSVAITNAMAGTQTLVITGTNTLGELVVGNTSSISMARSQGGAFRFDNGTQPGRIRGIATAGACTITAQVVYASGDLEVTNEAAATIWLVGDLSGFTNLVKSGAGTLQVYGNNAFAGDLVVRGGLVTEGNGTPAAGNIVPNGAWVRLEGGAEFKIQKVNEAVAGVKGSGIAYVSNSGRLVIGTNIADSATYTTRLVAGGEVRPGPDAATGDLYLNYVSAGKAQIRDGDVYMDIASNGFDRILFKYSANTISGGRLHLNFVGPYVPTNGASWNLLAATSGGTITDDTPENGVFTSIDSSLPGLRFTAEIAGGNTVRVMRQDIRRGALMVIR